MILACPACHGHYDVTGHEAGQRFRCRCGAILTLAAPARDVPEAAPVAGGDGVTDEISAPVPAAASAPEPQRPCPRCAGSLTERQIDDVALAQCGSCSGVFLDQPTAERVTTERSAARADALLRALPRQPIHPLPTAGQKMYLRCPTCQVVMNRKLLAAGTGVIVDVCRSHGTFFDAGELPLIIEFVMRGGLVKHHREVDPAREAARRELAQALAKSHALVADPIELPVARIHTHAPNTTAGALVELLADLFD